MALLKTTNFGPSSSISPADINSIIHVEGGVVQEAKPGVTAPTLVGSGGTGSGAWGEHIATAGSTTTPFHASRYLDTTSGAVTPWNTGTCVLWFFNNLRQHWPNSIADAEGRSASQFPGRLGFQAGVPFIRVSSTIRLIGTTDVRATVGDAFMVACNYDTGVLSQMYYAAQTASSATQEGTSTPTTGSSEVTQHLGGSIIGGGWSDCDLHGKVVCNRYMSPAELDWWVQNGPFGALDVPVIVASAWSQTLRNTSYWSTFTSANALNATAYTASVPAGRAQPTVPQIKAGTDGADVATGVVTGSKVLTADGQYELDVFDLAANTSYDHWLGLETEAGGIYSAVIAPDAGNPQATTNVSSAISLVNIRDASPNPNVVLANETTMRGRAIPRAVFEKYALTDVATDGSGNASAAVPDLPVGTEVIFVVDSSPSSVAGGDVDGLIKGTTQ